MKKAVIFSLIALLLAISLASVAGAQNSVPSPAPWQTGWPTDSSITPPVLESRVPGLPFSLIPEDYIPSKLTLSEAEKEALENIRVDQRVTITFRLPFFLQDQDLLWETSAPNVVALSATSGNTVDLIAVGSGEALITVYTAEGTFLYNFTVVVP